VRLSILGFRYMADQTSEEPDRGVARTGPKPEPVADPAGLHVASEQDVGDQRGRAERLEVVVRRADLRDQAAERRDRKAEARSAAGDDREGDLDRDWAGRDRDAAAVDRAELLDLIRDRSADTGETDVGDRGS